MGSDSVNRSEAGGWRAIAAAHYRQNQQQLSLPMIACTDCRYFVDNGVAHCNAPQVAGAVRMLMGDAPVHEMQVHFIRFTNAFCGIDAVWFEEKD
jgi:hypothetical protein